MERVPAEKRSGLVMVVACTTPEALVERTEEGTPETVRFVVEAVPK